MMAVDKKVVAIKHTVETKCYAHALPCLGHVERSSIIASERIRTIILRLAESVCLPATRNGNCPPRSIHSRYALLFPDTFHHLEPPVAVETLLHRRVSDWQNAAECI